MINSPFWRFFFLNLDIQDSPKKQYHFPTNHTKVMGGDLFLQEFCGRPPSAESRQLYEAAKINSPFWRFFFLNLDIQDSPKKQYHFPTNHTKVMGGDLFLQEFCDRPSSTKSGQIYEAAKINSPFWRFSFLNLDIHHSSKKQYHLPTNYTKVKGGKGDLFLQEFCGRPPSTEPRQLYESADVKYLSADNLIT
ncbi:hypothetical protein CDAR_212851 [Caerostris darwini]|uniref:Catalase n=1 Tax=Caerostris darwini TaxID=1538125 RepID=A0AAV4MDF0_9ARAC|nr:hypothetical protein CDAR_212851 [Caerostris darwini]